MHIGSSSPGKDRSAFRDVILTNARVNGELELEGASIDGTFNAAALDLQGALKMSAGGDKSTFKQVTLRGQKLPAMFTWRMPPLMSK